MGVSIDIDKLMRTLADKRTAFVSEADFQFALAWTIQQALPACNIRLEYCPFDIDRSMHADILLSLDGVYYPIELKYTTLAFDVVIDGERVARKSQGAHDILKYDYLKDIARIERLVVADKKFHAGWAILLTNDSSYWLEAKRNDTCDTAFKIHEGAVRGGRMAWAAHTGGTSKGREAPIELRESYPMNWRDYSRISDARWGRFRFLATKVMQNPIVESSLCNSSPI